MRRGSMRRRLVRGRGRGRRRMGYSRGRGVGLRTRRMALRVGPRTESKYFDGQFHSVLSTTGLITSGLASSLDLTQYIPPVTGGRVLPYLMSAIDQGAAVNQRIANRVFIRSLRFTAILNGAQLIGSDLNALQLAGTHDNFGQVTESGGSISTAAAPGTTLQKYIRTTFRLLIFRDRMVSLNNAVPAAPVSPSVDDVIESAGASYVLGNLNVQSLGRYQILYDRKFTTDADDPQRSVTLTIPVGMPAHFSGAGATDIREGALYWVAFAITGGLNSSLIGAKFHHPSILMSRRLQYSDR